MDERKPLTSGQAGPTNISEHADDKTVWDAPTAAANYSGANSSMPFSGAGATARKVRLAVTAAPASGTRVVRIRNLSIYGYRPRLLDPAPPPRPPPPPAPPPPPTPPPSPVMDCGGGSGGGGGGGMVLANGVAGTDASGNAQLNFALPVTRKSVIVAYACVAGLAPSLQVEARVAATAPAPALAAGGGGGTAPGAVQIQSAEAAAFLVYSISASSAAPTCTASLDGTGLSSTVGCCSSTPG